MRIDPRRTFRSIIASSSNRTAIELARRTSRCTRNAPNPLLVWGPTGVGKTLLLDAVAHDLTRRGIHRIVAITTEEFRNAYVRAIRSGTIPSFRHTFDECDGLIVDELEDLAGYPSALEELQQAIGVIVERGKPVVLAGAPTSTFEVEQMVRDFPRGALVTLRGPTITQRTLALVRHARLRGRRVQNTALTTIARTARTIGEATAQLDATLLSAQRDL